MSQADPDASIPTARWPSYSKPGTALPLPVIPPATPAPPAPSRRALLTGSTAALLAGAAAVPVARAVPLPVPAATGDDAELIALCDEFHRLHAAAYAPFVEEDEALMETALRWRRAASDQIALIPATTDTGRRAKAAVASAVLDEWGSLETSHAIIFARAVLRDIGGAGSGLALDKNQTPMRS